VPRGVLRRALERERTALRRALLAGLLVTGASVGLAGTSAWLIVRAAQRPAVLSLTVPMGLVQLFALAKAAGRYVERTQTHRAALSVMSHVRADVARLLEPLVPSGLGPRSAEVVDTVIGDVERVQDLLTAVAGPLITGAVAGLATTVICGLLAPLSAAALLAALVMTGVVTPWAAARLGEASECELDDVRRSMVELFARAAQSGDEYVMAGAGAVLRDELDALESRFDRAETRRTLVRGAAGAVNTAVAGACVLAAALASVRAFEAHRLAPSLLAVPALVSVAALELVSAVAPTLAGLRGDRRALSRIEGLAARPAPVVEPDVEGPDVGPVPTLALRDVGQRYDTRAVLDGVSLDLVPGDYVVVHGPSGGGKTTLARLIARFLDPSEGNLSLDGVDYRRLRSRQVREHVGFVDDAPYVFATSLAGNLRVAVPDADDDQLRRAAHLAGLIDLIASPEGLATSLDGVHGGLSGGERRRLGVARELLAARRVVVLDEPTEGLDEAAARALRARLAREYRDRALLVVSHLDDDDEWATRRLDLVDGELRETRAGASSAALE
jgi:thiol reductant ABC exporter CydC subunit